MLNLSVVIPVKNEEDSLVELHREICAVGEANPVSYTHLTLPTTPYV